MKNEVETRDSDFEPRVYEISYLIVPSVVQEKLQDKVAVIRALIEGENGRIIAEGEPKYRDLAYSMATIVANKRFVHENGYFGWIKFEIDPATTKKIHAALQKNQDIIRFMLITTMREDTLAPVEAAMTAEIEERFRKEHEKDMAAKQEATANANTDVPAVTVSKEEIDETIDKLITG